MRGRIDKASSTTGYAPVGNRCAAFLAVSTADAAALPATADFTESRSTKRVTSDVPGSGESDAEEALDEANCGQSGGADSVSSTDGPDDEAADSPDAGSAGAEGADAEGVDPGWGDPG